MLVVFLAVHVVKFRRSEKVGVGLGSEAMQRAIRAHANALENIPIGLLLLLMLELNHLNPWLLNILGLAFFVSRALHAWGMTHKSGPSFGRIWGTLICWICILVMAILNILIIATR